MHVRHAKEADHSRIVQAISSWWSDSRGPDEVRELSLLVPRVFLQHFASTSFVAEAADGRMVGFLVGLLSYDRPRDAYIHFVGIAPEQRRMGLARQLYRNFFDVAIRADRVRVQCITSPGNSGSIAFHRRMGFELVPGDAEREGVPVHTDYDGRGHERVCFQRELSSREPLNPPLGA